MRPSRRRIAVLLFAAFAATTGLASAQFGRGFGDFGFGEAVRFAPADLPDRNFTVCRIMYTSSALTVSQVAVLAFQKARLNFSPALN